MKGFIVISFIIFLLAGSCGIPDKKDYKKADHGFMDLSVWNFEQDGNVVLDGEWEFYWNRLLTPRDFQAMENPGGYCIKVPGKWLQKDNKEITGYGCATYRLTVKVSPGQYLGIRIPIVWTACSLWVNDTKIIESGVPGCSRETTKPYALPHIAYFKVPGETLVLTLQVSNYDDVWGGVSDRIILGSFSNIQQYKINLLFLNAFFFGAGFILALYHILVLRKREYNTQLFGIFCLIISIRFLFTNDFLILNFFHGDLLTYWEWGKRLGYTLMYFSAAIFLLLMRNFYPDDFSKTITYIYLGLAFIFSLLLYFFPFRIFVYMMFVYQVLIIVVSVYILVVLIRKLIRSREGTVLSMLIGYVVLAATSTNDILYANNVIQTGEFLHIGLLVFILFFSINLSIRFSSLYYKIQNLSRELQTYSKELEQKVKARTIELEEANKRKTNFFINIIHETKTPLTIIANYIDKDIKTRGISEDIKIVKQNLDKLKRDMINFLDMEKINRGQVFYDHKQTINLSKAVNLKIILFKEIAARKNITIQSDVEKSIMIKIDPYAIDRIINNLIDNAIRYTNQGGQIIVTLIQTESNIQFCVKDTGIGISKEKQQALFEPFYQLSHEKRNVQGIGVGLSIVKKIMDQVNGRIDVASEKGIGTTFTLHFQASKLDAHTNTLSYDQYSQPIDTFFSAQLLAEYYNPEKDTVLIVEDNINLLAYIQLSLMDRYNVFYARNGVEAIDKLKKMTRPQVIVSDIMMDEMDGYEFFGILKNDKRFCSIPFIFLTVKNTLQEKLEGLGRGAIDFIFKPFSIDELLAKINAVIKNQQSMREYELSEIEIKLSRFLRINFQKEGLSRLEELCHIHGITKREKDVIVLLSKGLEYKEISYQLNISINTLKPYIHKIYKKLKVQNKVELTNLINLW